MARAVAVLAAIFGLLIAIVPQFILPVCSASLETKAGTLVPMKCFWTARAELAVGALIVLTGLLLFVSRDWTTTRSLHILLSGLGIVALLIPTVLIGVCANPTMACHIGTLPALIVEGSLVTVIGLAGIALAVRGESLGAPWPVA